MQDWNLQLTRTFDVTSLVLNEAAQAGLMSIFVHLLSILLCWWALQSFRFDAFLKQPKSAQANMLRIILSVVLGYQFASFVLSYANWSSTLKWLF